MGILSLITTSTEALVAMVFKYLKILKLKLGYFNVLYEASLSLTQLAYIYFLVKFHIGVQEQVFY